MQKSEELSNPNSCFNRATEDERMFVLLARDECAPATIRFWVKERIRTGRNAPHDAQIGEALGCASRMERGE